MLNQSPILVLGRFLGFLSLKQEVYVLRVCTRRGTVMVTPSNGDDGLRKAFEAFLLKHHARDLYELIVVVERNEPSSPPSLHVE